MDAKACKYWLIMISKGSSSQPNNIVYASFIFSELLLRVDRPMHFIDILLFKFASSRRRKKSNKLCYLCFG